MIASNETVIRFIALYGRGFSFPVRHLILGHGYQNRGGHTHSVLAKIYEKDHPSQLGKMYAGYLSLEDGELKVFDGGNETLKIPREEHLDKKLTSELNLLSGLKQAVIQLFPLITSNQVCHVLIAEQ